MWRLALKDSSTALVCTTLDSRRSGGTRCDSRPGLRARSAPVPGSPFAAGRFPTSVTTTAAAKSCKHDHEERDRDERGGDDEQREGRGQDDDEHQGHFSFNRKHGCHHSGEKDFEEHGNDIKVDNVR